MKDVLRKERERERGRKRERGGRESELEKDNEQKHTGDWSGDSGRDPDSSEKKDRVFQRVGYIALHTLQWH